MSYCPKLDQTPAHKIAGLALTLLLVASPMAAQAYIGPGVGAGALGVVLGIIGSVFLALFAVLYYPIKRMIKKRRKERTEETDPTKPAS